MQFSQI